MARDTPRRGKEHRDRYYDAIDGRDCLTLGCTMLAFIQKW